MIVAEITGIPVTPSPQAMSEVTLSRLATLEEGVEEGALLAGRKGDIPLSSTLDRHEIPSAASMREGLGIATDELPAIQLPVPVHSKTGSFGGVTAARNYRKAELALIKAGKVEEAFEMGVRDL
ncbi:hypothetical protein LZZ85_04760 [Terrimonas sp. NA20]|uniref:Uncharacterized protein n=1 Tax=Terrimonas ginsenosidimutans TaxID=2908004 RepID=A0ABS9KMM8_9BACT|nr:hypothetical protein [Terrimonas ginsenosidimutans]MCG2613576.1 hypothetical protein [Terrimonas ginsenosidimutans]